MSKARTNTLTLLLASLGCLVALVLFYKHLRPEANVGCTIFRSDCNHVIDSDYGHVGPIPTSLLGLGMYLTVIALCLKRRKLMTADQNARQTGQRYDPTHAPLTKTEKEQALSELGISADSTPAPSPPVAENPNLQKLDLALWLIALAAFGVSWWLQYISLFVVLSLCPWCFSSACLVTLLLAVTSYDYLLRRKKLVGEQLLMAGTLVFIGAALFMIGLPGITNQITNIILHASPPIHQEKRLPELRSKDMEITGNPNLPVLVVEFADYQCEHCQKAALMMAEFMKQNPDRFRLAFRNFPLPMHSFARPAALAAEAAGEQHKFWEMHDYIYQHQSDMEKKDFTIMNFRSYAEAIGLDLKRFDADVQNEKIAKRVDDDLQAGRAVVTSTPTFFIYNGMGAPWVITGMGDMKTALDDPTNKVWQREPK